ncbi:MAG: EamA/RhaT family transporter, partial [Rhodospirillales bacterium]|nr:EamA/RhaT family transporter [Rhodospirillales bacterium]
FVWFKIVASAPVTVSSVSTLLIPVIGVASGSVVLGEAVGWREAVALILVCVALGCVLMPSGRSRPVGRRLN